MRVRARGMPKSGKRLRGGAEVAGCRSGGVVAHAERASDAEKVLDVVHVLVACCFCLTAVHPPCAYWHRSRKQGAAKASRGGSGGEKENLSDAADLPAPWPADEGGGWPEAPAAGPCESAPLYNPYPLGAPAPGVSGNRPQTRPPRVPFSTYRRSAGGERRSGGAVPSGRGAESLGGKGPGLYAGPGARSIPAPRPPPPPRFGTHLDQLRERMSSSRSQRRSGVRHVRNEYKPLTVTTQRLMMFPTYLQRSIGYRPRSIAESFSKDSVPDEFSDDT